MSPTTPSSLSDQPSGSGAASLNQTIQTIFSSSNSNILLAAIISLLLVILFVLILHVYAKWFLAHARRRRRRNSISVTHILGPNRLHHFHYDTSHSTNDTDNGLDASVIASIPLFVHSLYGSGEQVSPECVICLSGYEEGDIGRKLRKCGHDFHVECIDMWLRSHSSCPICRAPVVSMDEKINGGDDDDGEIVIVIDDQDDHEQHEVGDSDSESVASAVASAACCSCSCASQSPAPATEKRMVSCKNKSERRVHPS